MTEDSDSLAVKVSVTSPGKEAQPPEALTEHGGAQNGERRKAAVGFNDDLKSNYFREDCPSSARFSLSFLYVCLCIC